MNILEKIKGKVRGFTLVELMVVIAIIAILTAIITANFAQSKAKARDAKRVSDIAQIQLALELFFDRCNGYPPTITTTATLGSCPSGITLGNYISKVPTDNGTPYTYTPDNPTSPTDYVLQALLETDSSSLTDASDATSVGGNPVTCTHPTGGPYNYCVRPN